MKKYGFYSVVLLQVIAILFFAVQFEQIDSTGREIKLVGSSDYYEMEGAYLTGNILIEYDIKTVVADLYSGDIALDKLSYNTALYVLLKPDDSDVFQLANISNEKIDAADGEVIVKAKFMYKEHDRNEFWVDYRYQMQQVEDIEQYGDFRNTDELVVTILHSKWGQYKVTDVRKK